MDRTGRTRTGLSVVAFLGAALVVASCAPSMRPAPVFQGDRLAKRLPPARQTVKLRPPPARPPGLSRSGANSGAALGAIVRKGDTLYRISRRHQVALRDLIDVNRLNAPYRLVPGQRLRLPYQRMHDVRKGETLHGVSRRYGIEMGALVRINNIPPPYRILAGQRLRLPRARGELRRAALRIGAAPADRARIVLVRPSARKLPPKDISPRRSGKSLGTAALAHPPPRAGGRFLWPVRGPIAVGFGARAGGLHNDGINILARRGTRVRAAENGIVAYAGNELRGFGNLLLIKHSGGWMSAYAHNEALLVRAGDRVRRGQTISRVGTTGSVVRPQLHFELRRGRRAVDPVKLLARRRATKMLSPDVSRIARRGPE